MTEIQPIIDALQAKFPWLASVLFFIGAMRLLSKPVSGWVQILFTKLVVFVTGTPEKDDDDWLKSFLASKPYRFVAFVVDLVASVKLPNSDSLAKVDAQASANPPIMPMLLVIACCFSFTGCALFKAEPAKVAANVSDASKITIEAALAAWNDYIPVGQPTLEQQAKVREIWKRYRAAQLLILDTAIILKEAETAGLDTAESQAAMNRAIAEAGNALADIIAALRTFGVKL